MAKSYDVTTKRLIDLHPQDWLRLVGFSDSQGIQPFDVELIDSDLATISASSDRVLKIVGPPETLHHVELETGHHGSNKPNDLLSYSALLTRKYKLPVETSVILLRRQADSPVLTGKLDLRRRDGSRYLHFEYNIVRVWDIPVATLLAGGIGTLPLAPLANAGSIDLPSVVERMKERIDAYHGQDKAELWTAANIIMGLRYSRAVAENLLKGVQAMKESVTYQAILEEGEAKGRAEGEAKGRVDGELQMLLRMASPRLGQPLPRVDAILKQIDSADRLLELADRVLAVESWEDLLDSDL